MAARRAPHVPGAGTAVPPFEAFLREVLTTRHSRAEGLTLTAQHLLIEVTRLFAGEGGVDRRLPHPAVAHARRLIDEAYTERLPLAQLARTVGMSPTYLTTLFTAEIGLSPARYQRQLRTRRAEVLLAETDRTITQIAVDLGFSSAQHFATVFREHTGLTPRAYRRSILARGEH